MNQDLDDRYTLAALAKQANQEDRDGTDWFPHDCSPAEHRLIGLQLAQLDEFCDWPGLRPYRQGVRGVILRDGISPEAKVTPVLATILRTQPGGRVVEALNFSAKTRDLDTIRDATMALLTRGLLWPILEFLVCRTSWFSLLWLALTSLALIWRGWGGAAGVGLAVPCIAMVLLAAPAWKWAAILNNSAVYLTIDRERGQYITGASFGVPTCLAIIAALAILYPPPVGVLHVLARALTEEDMRRAYTGVVERRGQVKEVEPGTVSDKVEAMQAALITRGYFPAANGPFSQRWVVSVSSLSNVTARLLGVPDRWAVLEKPAYLLFVGLVWPVILVWGLPKNEGGSWLNLLARNAGMVDSREAPTNLPTGPTTARGPGEAVSLPPPATSSSEPPRPGGPAIVPGGNRRLPASLHRCWALRRRGEAQYQSHSDPALRRRTG